MKISKISSLTLYLSIYVSDILHWKS